METGKLTEQKRKDLCAGRVKLADIAKCLDLDISSVSLALAGSTKISEKTAAKVRQVAQDLGYQPNIAARQLRKGGHLAIGLAIPPKGLNYYVVIKTIQELSLLALDKKIIFTIISCPSSESAVCEQFIPDGLLIWGDIPFQDVRKLCVNGQPFVVIDPNDTSYLNRDFPSVRFDNAGGASAVVEHLLERGAKRLLVVKAQEGHLGHDERCSAARATWLKSRPVHKISNCLLSELSDENLKSFSADSKGAIFCSNDQAAVEIWHRLSKLGLGVPENLALAGFDGDPYGEYFGLTTALVDAKKLAGAAFDILSGIMDRSNKKISSKIIPVELHIGKTT